MGFANNFVVSRHSTFHLPFHWAMNLWEGQLGVEGPFVQEFPDGEYFRASWQEDEHAEVGRPARRPKTFTLGRAGFRAHWALGPLGFCEEYQVVGVHWWWSSWAPSWAILWGPASSGPSACSAPRGLCKDLRRLLSMHLWSCVSQAAQGCCVVSNWHSLAALYSIQPMCPGSIPNSHVVVAGGLLLARLLHQCLRRCFALTPAWTRGWRP